MEVNVSTWWWVFIFMLCFRLDRGGKDIEEEYDGPMVTTPYDYDN